MAKPIVAKTFRVRGNATEGLVIVDFADFSDRSFQFLISPLAVDSLCEPQAPLEQQTRQPLMRLKRNQPDTRVKSDCVAREK
jgi:hypothetical protein